MQLVAPFVRREPMLDAVEREARVRDAVGVAADDDAEVGVREKPILEPIEPDHDLMERAARVGDREARERRAEVHPLRNRATRVHETNAGDRRAVRGLAPVESLDDHGAMAHASHPRIKAFVDSGCQSWLIACPSTNRALLVDPKVGRAAAYDKALADFGWTLTAALDTHTHADHLSDSTAWLARGIPVFMSRHTGVRRPITRVGDGDTIEVGALRFRVIEVPGHTPDSIALFGHGIVVTGDSLFAGALARADFRGSDPTRLFDSVTRRLMTLPDETVVLPGHGYRDVLFSTIGAERKKNPALRHEDGAAYARALAVTEGAGNTPDVDAILATNVSERPDLPSGDAGPTVACCAGHGGAETASAKIRERTAAELKDDRARVVADGAWIDVRDEWEYRASHITGARNVPLGELGFHVAELRAHPPAVLSCLGGVRSMTAARTLKWLDVPGDPISLAGGFRAWEAASLPVER